MTDAPAGVAIYVHWPYCARICPYCDFNVVRDRGRVEQQAALIRAILTDLDGQAATLGSRSLASIFFGGGTPSLMPPSAVAAVIDGARALFPTGEPVEITLEANPTDAESGRFEALSQAGVDRLSLGVQSFDDATLAFLGRNHSAAEARRALTVAAHAFPRLSMDLIYAHPGQTPDAWGAELEIAAGYAVEHLSPYQLTIEPTTAFGRAFARGDLVPPDDDRAADLYDATQRSLEAHGYEAYEVSNHARGLQARSRHNLHVWRGGDYIGVGPGAHGRLTIAGQRVATVAYRGIADYIAGVAAGSPWAERNPLSDHDAAEERLLLGLRTVEGVGAEMFARLGLAGEDAALAGLIDDGFLVSAGGRIAATARGRPVLDSVLRALLT